MGSSSATTASIDSLWQLLAADFQGTIQAPTQGNLAKVWEYHWHSQSRECGQASFFPLWYHYQPKFSCTSHLPPKAKIYRKVLENYGELLNSLLENAKDSIIWEMNRRTHTNCIWLAIIDFIIFYLKCFDNQTLGWGIMMAIWKHLFIFLLLLSVLGMELGGFVLSGQVFDHWIASPVLLLCFSHLLLDVYSLEPNLQLSILP